MRHRRRAAFAPLILATVSLTALAACGDTSPTATPASSSPSVAASPLPGGDLALRPIQGDADCDSIQVQYKSAMFHIDPTADEPVIAVTETGKRLQTFWATGFQGSAAERVVRDPAGQVVASEGEILTIPVGAFPSLHGHFVCPSDDTLYVFVEQPS